MFYFRFVPWAERTRWDNDSAIMTCQLFIRALKDRLVAVGFGDADLRVIRDVDRRGSTEGRQGADVRAQPVRQRLGARGFRVGIVARAPDRHEHRGVDRRLIVRAVNRDLGPRVVDEELLAGDVPLAHRARRVALPAPVMGAELAVAVRRRAVLSAILLPEQLQRDMPMALELLVDRGARRHDELRRPTGRLAIHTPLELGVIPDFRDRPFDPSRPCRLQILRDRPDRQPGTRCDLAHCQPRGRQPQYLPDPVHGDPLARHPSSSRQKAGAGKTRPNGHLQHPAAAGYATVNTLYAIVNTVYGNPRKLFTITPIPCSRSPVIHVHDPP